MPSIVSADAHACSAAVIRGDFARVAAGEAFAARLGCAAGRGFFAALRFAGFFAGVAARTRGFATGLAFATGRHYPGDPRSGPPVLHASRAIR
jgi:hypothetical protein